ncbi:MAG: hypothetical protein PHI28_03220 [Mangrovibacterium sp.]|nr:hypothetical protein [Mangrovibacterium sp.]
MKMAFTYRIRRILACICLGVVVMLIVNDIVFLHAHELSNSGMIIHAHPYNKKADSAPLKEHHHATADYIAIQISQILFPCVVISLPAVLFYFRASYSSAYRMITGQLHLPGIPGRSPPF